MKEYEKNKLNYEPVQIEVILFNEEGILTDDVIVTSGGNQTPFVPFNP